jgi:sugar phosphate isomerase/epimerase
MGNHSPFYSRRQMLRLSGSAIIAIGCSSSAAGIFSKKKNYRIGACDWSIGKVSDISLIAQAKRIGLDGLQLDLGSIADEYSLWHAPVQQAYKQAAEKSGIEISSLAIGQLNKIPYKSEPATEQWVQDSIDVARTLGCKIILIPFFGAGDLKQDEAGKQEVIRRLKKVAPKAEQAGIILGLESWLSAEEHLEIIRSVGSKNVRVYYDVANSNKMGYDIYQEIASLGTEYICEIHAKENGALLGEGKIDFSKVKAILDQMNYSGWVVIESAVPKGADVYASYVANNKYLRSVLNKE